MTQDRIIELARKAGLKVATNISGVTLVGSPLDGLPAIAHITIEEMERFAALVRAEALEEAAGMCEARSMAQFPQSHAGLGFSFSQQWDAARTAERQCASAIRLLNGQP